MGFPQSKTPTNQDSIFLQTQFRFESFVDGLSRNEENPYGVLGSDGFDPLGSTTVDTFRNQTPKIQGVYEWVKMLVCMPIVLLRLVLFGLCMLIGYVWHQRSHKHHQVLSVKLQGLHFASGRLSAVNTISIACLALELT
ncbi:putative plasmalogen synthase [Helianthus annuus]|nr:putative plasmalogen synthase [Helianthus annuus]